MNRTRGSTLRQTGPDYSDPDQIPSQEALEQLSTEEVNRILEAVQQAAERQRNILRIQELRSILDSSNPQNTTAAHAASPQSTSTPFFAQLPKAEPPTRFEGKGRQQYNHWVRDCERYLQHHSSFSTEETKCAFAEQYLGSAQRDHWERERAALAQEEITWDTLKETMLNMLGSPHERRQRAITRIKEAKQGTRPPSMVLEYLKAQWADIGDDATNEATKHRQISELLSCLNPSLQNRINAIGKPPQDLVEAENVASEQWRLQRNEERIRSRQPRPIHPNTRPRPFTNPHRPWNGKPQHHSNRVWINGRQPIQRPTLDSQQAAFRNRQYPTRNPITCYKCGKPGHIAPNCNGTQQNLKLQAQDSQGN